MVAVLPGFDSDEDRWQAVVERNASADSLFFYSVASTGIFCRPGCGSRLPLRRNVAFHASATAARAAGFRPCLRCNPEQDPLSSEWAGAVARACRSIEESKEPLSTPDLARAAAMSTSHFQRVFRRVTGMTPKSYAQSVRSARVQLELRKEGTIADAVYKAGFNSNSRFYEGSSRTLGMTPAAYRSGGLGLTIRFGVGQCSLGAILVAATSIGVCAVLMDDHPEALPEELRKRFPQADIVPGDPEFDGWMATVLALVEAPGERVELPLDIRGTAFQHLVWQTLRGIPAGSTASYSEIAHRIGRPRAARAVAAACAANKVAVVIPCHRVVRSDDSLSGYRWGVERKRELLRRESEPSGGGASEHT
ncbi:MAG TPA: bifunctional DNA-binding transcriptional regulator/O6-methylguanine-DNA methyltransferase Ada [Actinomycetota bacterium]|nr:bifunctional DNA-binding transcriptional regulator/O6-methylguanine-DNA methyltransferase Ada [Actinomycetota bacterium]